MPMERASATRLVERCARGKLLLVARVARLVHYAHQAGDEFVPRCSAW